MSDPIAEAIARLLAKDERKARRPHNTPHIGKNIAGNRTPPWEAQGITRLQWIMRNQHPKRRATMRIKPGDPCDR